FTAPVTTPVVEFPREPKEALGVGPSSAPAGPVGRRSWNPKVVASAVIVILALSITALAARGLLSSLFNRPAKNDFSYTQITDFTDSAVAPVLSPDGKMVAFIRGNTWFLSP